MTEAATRVRYQILTWLTVAAGLSYLCRNAVSVAESTIRAELGLSLEQSGWFMGAFFWTYAILQIPGGWIAQKYGTRLTLTVMAISWSVSTMSIGLAAGFYTLIIAQLVMGLSQAGIFPASCNSIGHWMPLSQRSFSCGILAAGMQLGAIIASGITGDLMDWAGWRMAFFLLAIPGILWALWFVRRFHDDPGTSSSVNSAELRLISESKPSVSAEKPRGTEWQSLGIILKSPLIWFLCGQQIARAAGYMFYASWFPTFLQETRGVSVRESGYLQGLVLTGTLAGSVCGGLLTDWMWRRTGSLRLSRSGVGGIFLAACAALTLAAWSVESVQGAVLLLSAGSLLAALAGPCALAAAIDLGGNRVPMVFGLMNMMGNLAAAMCPIAVGWLFEWSANWNLVLLVFAAVYLFGAVCWIFVNPQQRLSID